MLEKKLKKTEKP